jgi:PAS domain S-box-containing protein
MREQQRLRASGGADSTTPPNADADAATGSARSRQLGEEQLRLLLERFPGIVWSTDPQLRFTSSKGAALARIGLEADQVVGMSLQEFLGTDDPEASALLAHRHALAGEPATYEGTWAGVEYQAFVEPLRDEGGSIIGVIGIAGDVTARREAEDALRASEGLFRSLLESASEAVLVTDQAGTITLVNQKTERLLGYSKGELIGQSVELLVPEHLREAHVAARNRYVSAPVTRPMNTRADLTCRRKDGSLFTASIGLSHAQGGQESVVLALITDVTESRQAAEDLQHQAGRLAVMHEIDAGVLAARSVQEIARVATERIREILPCDHAMVNLSYSDSTGGIVDSTDGQSPHLAHGTRVRLEDLGAWIEMHRRGLPFVVEDLELIVDRSPVLEGMFADGFRSLISMPFMLDGRPAGALTLSAKTPGAFEAEHLAIARELADSLTVAIAQTQLREELELRAEELERTLADLRRTDRERRRLLSRLLEAQEQERHRIASDIHDDAIQKLTAVGMRLHLVFRQHPELTEDPNVTTLLQTVDTTIQSMRGLVFDLRPHVLDTDGLAAALRLFGEQRMESDGLDFVVVNDLVEEPPLDARVVLYRIAQEALTNVRKHAQASSVRVILDEPHGGYRIRVIDDGMGLQGGAQEDAGPLHFGLSSMRERADMAGGRLSVESSSGSGTTVDCWVPRSAAEFDLPASE